MKHSVLFTVFLLFSCMVSADMTLIENVIVVSPERKTPLKNAYVLLKDGVIDAVSANVIKAPKNAVRINGEGHYLIPGLIDSHVHIAKVPSMRFRHKKEYPELVRKFQKQQPRSYLYFGFTTLIDLNVFSVKQIELFKSQPAHPDLHTCGKHLDIANGHGMFEEDPKTRLRNNPNFLYDHYQKQHLQGQFSLQDHTVEKAIKRIKESGAICIKTYYENGYGGSEMADYDIPTPQIIRDVVKEARKQNLPTLIHANSWESQRFALMTEVDVIAHGMFHWGEYRHEDRVPDAIHNTLKSIAEKRVGYQPTLHVIDSQRSQFTEKYLSHPELQHAYPEDLITWYKTDEGQWFKKGIRQYLPRHLHHLKDEQMFEFFDKFYQKNIQVLGVLAQLDANLLFGTDTIIGQSFANAPGLSGYIDLQGWRLAGVSLKQIFEAATINNARTFNLDSILGTVESGKKANLLLLRKSPLESVEAYNSIVKVILNGQVIPRNEFSATQI